MPMHNLIEYNDDYSKTSGGLWQYYRDKPAVNNNSIITDFPNDNDSAFLTGQTGNDRTKDVQIMVPLIYLSNFWRTLEIPLSNCEINLFLTWSANYLIMAGAIDNHLPTFKITDAKLYFPVVTLSAQDNAKVLQQLKTGLLLE